MPGTDSERLEDTALRGAVAAVPDSAGRPDRLGSGPSAHPSRIRVRPEPPESRSDRAVIRCRIQPAVVGSVLFPAELLRQAGSRACQQWSQQVTAGHSLS